jgi:VWFA-related protein
MRQRLMLVLGCVTLLIAACSVVIFGQSIPSDELRWGTRPYTPQLPGAIRVRSDMVEIPVIVRDSHSNPVAGLKQTDFEVYDEGKKRDISFFSVETAPRMSAQEAVTDSARLEHPASPIPSAASPKPRYVAFYFDDTSTNVGDIKYSREAAEHFVREGIDPGDRVGIFTSSTTVLQDFTDDKQKLLDAIGQIRTHLKRANEGPAACPNLTTYQAYLITEMAMTHSDAYDLGVAQALLCGACRRKDSSCTLIVLNAARETLALSEQFSQDTLGIISDVILHLGKMPGRRMLVLSSSGFMTQTLGEKQNRVIDAAVHAGVVINSLDAKGLWASSPGGDLSEAQDRIIGGPLGAYQDRLDDMTKEINNDPLALLADGTGGKFFHNSNDLITGFRELAEVPAVSYMLGFYPEDLKPSQNLHSLKVKLINVHDVTIQARRGYYPPTRKDVELTSAASAKRGKLEQAVLSNDRVTEIPAEVSAQPVQSEGGAQNLKVIVHVSIANLPFESRSGRNLEHLVFVTALFDTNNQFMTGVEGLMELSLKDSTKAQLASHGLDASFSLAAPPGTYRLREVVEETAGSRLSASSKTVEIH